ncbi:hypothetical protein ACOSQ3_009786 [Xanthoceras sorbifolium]
MKKFLKNSPNLTNRWAKEVEVKRWVLELDVRLFLLFQSLILLDKLFTLLGQFVPLPLKEFLKVTQLIPSSLKSDLQLTDLGYRLFHLQLHDLSEGLGLLDLCSQQLFTLHPNSELPPFYLALLGLKHVLVHEPSGLKKYMYTY